MVGIMNNDKNLYDNLSERRKAEQEAGTLPDWYTTASYQMFTEKYLFEVDSFKDQITRVANTAAKHLPIAYRNKAAGYFFELMWKGWLSPSTPVLANMGTNRGLPVSCSGAVIPDSIDGFYNTLHETAQLTKHGFGTSAYLGDIRPRGTPISIGGKASGVLPVFKMFVQAMRDVSQGTARRGAWAGYLPIDHGDFYALIEHISEFQDDANIGWNISDSFIERLNSGDADAIARYQRALKLKMVTGKGYFFFPDKANRNRPQMYKDHDLTIKNSNLCSEIMLFNDYEHTYTCVLSTMNVSKYDEWKDTDAVFWSTVFLDCVASEFIEKAKNIPGLEKAVRFTEKGRALGLGVMGLHTYFQKNMIPFESLRAQFLNTEIFSRIHGESLDASQWLATILGEPEWCKGYGVRNTHRIAIAPTKSSSILMGGVSEGISPDPGMSYVQTTAAGEIERINPQLLIIMKERGVYNKKVLKKITESFGSVQPANWLSAEEKLVFKTAFEIDQNVIIRYASQRAKYIDQWQSLNLFFASGESEELISQVHKTAFTDPNILALYYSYSKASIGGSKECVACSA